MFDYLFARQAPVRGILLVLPLEDADEQRAVGHQDDIEEFEQIWRIKIYE